MLNPYFVHEKCDINGYYNNMIYPPSHCKIILRVSWLSAISGTYALYCQHYDMALVPYSVFISSNLYWSRPVFNCNMRYIDIIVVISGMSYQIVKSFNSDQMSAYLLTIILAMTFYPISNYYYYQNSWISVILYSFLHILANVSNIILYQSNIK